MLNTICNGYKLPHVEFTSEERARLTNVIHEEREKLRQPVDRDLMLYCGDRFEDDDSVLWTMESADRGRLFAQGDHNAVRDALLDCMSRDYWYKFEKDWG